jgi:SH3-like domain-containing protein
MTSHNQNGPSRPEPKRQNKPQAKFQGAYSGGAWAQIGGVIRGKLWWMVLVALGWLIVHLPQTSEAQAGSFDTPSKYPVPRWVTIRSSDVNARKGPSKDHAVLWTYKQKGMPVQVISETREWRLICDADGTMGWVRHDMVSARRAVMAVSPSGVELKDGPNDKSAVKAILRPHALARIEKCKGDYCRISLGRGGLGGDSGWVRQSALWGTQTEPACKRPGAPS